MPLIPYAAHATQHDLRQLTTMSVICTVQSILLNTSCADSKCVVLQEANTTRPPPHTVLEPTSRLLLAERITDVVLRVTPAAGSTKLAIQLQLPGETYT